MTQETQRVRVEEIQWTTLLPFVRLFGATKTALHPPMLLTALLTVVVLWLAGHAMDVLWGPDAFVGETTQYANLSTDGFDRWITLNQQSMNSSQGVYLTAQYFKLDAFNRLVAAASQLNFGLGALLEPAQPHHRTTVVGAMRDMAVTLPGWLWHYHRWFLISYGVIAWLVWALLGGVMSRMAAIHATRNERVSVRQALGFAKAKWGWFVLTPLIPPILAAMVAVVPIAMGLAFFNLPGLDILGGALFFIPLICGMIITFLMLLLAASGPMLYPAIAIEGTDAFDAISRSFGYVLGRPWRWLFYNLVALVYGAIVYLIVGVVIYGVILVTQKCVGLLVFTQTADGVNRFTAILPPPRVGQLPEAAQWSQLGALAKTASGLVYGWVYLTALLLAAFAVGFFVSVNTWVYLLLRRSTDGTEFDDIFIEEAETQSPSSAVDQTDPPAPQPAGDSAADDENKPGPTDDDA